jgi:hypothetical protein
MRSVAGQTVKPALANVPFPSATLLLGLVRVALRRVLRENAGFIDGGRPPSAPRLTFGLPDHEVPRRALALFGGGRPLPDIR